MSRPKLPRPTPRMKVLLAHIEAHGPISPNDLTDVDGICRDDVDYYLREMKKEGLVYIQEGLVYIHSYGPSPCRTGYTVKLYAAGDGIDAKRPLPPRRKYRRKGGEHGDAVARGREMKAARREQAIVHIPPRDALAVAMFGEAA
jgi:hypothetical protein